MSNFARNVQVLQAAIGNVQTGHETATTSIVQLTTADIPSPLGVLLKCPTGNTEPVYVGHNDPSGVTADTTDATAGMPIDPGESQRIYVDNVSDIYIRVSTGTESIHWLAEVLPANA